MRDPNGQPETELARLREAYPAWDIRESWITAASGPDRRHLLARRGDITVRAWTAAQLARDIESAEERDQ